MPAQELVLPSATSPLFFTGAGWWSQGRREERGKGGLECGYGSKLSQIFDNLGGFCIHNVWELSSGKAVTDVRARARPPHVGTCGFLSDIIALVERSLSDYVFKTCFLLVMRLLALKPTTQRVGYAYAYRPCLPGETGSLASK